MVYIRILKALGKQQTIRHLKKSFVKIRQTSRFQVLIILELLGRLSKLCQCMPLNIVLNIEQEKKVWINNLSSNTFNYLVGPGQKDWLQRLLKKKIVFISTSKNHRATRKRVLLLKKNK